MLLTSLKRAPAARPCRDTLSTDDTCNTKTTTRLLRPLGVARDASAGERTPQVNLRQPLPLILFYTTAVAMPDGTIHFASDIYRHDQRLDRALAQRRGA